MAAANAIRAITPKTSNPSPVQQTCLWLIDRFGQPASKIIRQKIAGKAVSLVCMTEKYGLIVTIGIN